MPDLLGLQPAIEKIQAAGKELEKDLAPDTALIFNRLDLSVQNAVQLFDALLTKHEGAASNFLDGFEIVVSFRKKTP